MATDMLKGALAKPVRLASGMLATGDRLLWPRTGLRYPPLFIVAPPRSGTTLLYQVMAESLSVCYTSNLLRFSRLGVGHPLPVLSSLLARCAGLSYGGGRTLQSSYGHVDGLAGPDEGHAVWNLGFPVDTHAVGAGSIQPADAAKIYGTVSSIERVFGRPFLNKCIRHSVRLEALADVFPRAIFLRCRRAAIDVAQSIHVARTRDQPQRRSIEKQNPHKYWFSVKPPEYARIARMDLVDQVCHQVLGVERCLDEAEETLGRDRFLSVEYEAFCEEPLAALRRIVDFMTERGAKTRIVKLPPRSFTASSRRRVTEVEYQRMQAILGGR